MGDDLEKFENYEILEDYYVIEAILDKKRQKGVWKYKVKWEGYPMDQCTWEPQENLLNCKELFQKFEFEWNQKKNSSKSFTKSTAPSSIISDETETPKMSESPVISKKENELISDQQDVEMKATEVNGDFESDIGDNIIDAKIINHKDIELNCLVRWQKRGDGTQAHDTWFSSNIVRKRDPELLLKFYEKRIKLPVFDQKSYKNNKIC